MSSEFPKPYSTHQGLMFEDCIRLRLPEADIKQWLSQLTPEAFSIRSDADVTFQAFIQILREMAEPVPTLDQALQERIIDCCGTGGSGLPHYNVSTTAAFIMASGDVPVVKFGNRAIRSKSGSFDFLEQLGFRSEISLMRLPEILDSCHLAFLYAPHCYPALAPFNRLRREVGVTTIFNFLGPLLNPIQPAYRLLGVSHQGMQPLMARALMASNPSFKKGWVVHGLLENDAEPELGWDEITLHGETKVLEIEGTTLREFMLYPEESESPPPLRGRARVGGETYSVVENVIRFQAITCGEDRRSDAYRQSCLNAGAGFYIANMATSLQEGVLFAEELLQGGKVLETVIRCRKINEEFQ